MSPRSIFSLIAVVSLALCPLSPLAAQSTNRQVGTQYTVTADPLVQRPHETPCVVQLFNGFQFAHFSEATQTFAYAPPANCPGPWEKVVFEADFSENSGIQYDRTASIYIGNANIYFGTTPEPLQTQTNTWHVERDLTDYSALLTAAQTGTMVLGNCTSECGPQYTGVFTVSGYLQFYPAKKHGNTKLDTPDLVMPLVQATSGGGINLPAYLNSPTDQLATTFTLPRNIERVYLDVISQSQSTDEQWYACFPNDLNPINELFGCGNTDFRETEITIDGQPAGIAPVSPWVYTGFLPDQWVPIPAVQTLEFVPYRVDLTPFAALLSDGNQHTVALSVFNDDNYFTATASLLLYLDHGTTQVTGGITKNTLTAPSPAVTENLQGTSTVTGTIGVTSNRNFMISGWANTSHGRVDTTISEQQRFTSNTAIDFDVVNFTVLDQNTDVNTSVARTTTVHSREGNLVTQDTFNFPISVDVVLPVPAAYFGLTVNTTQHYTHDQKISRNGELQSFSFVSNQENGSDISPASSWQHYTSFDSDGDFYDCRIATANNMLTSVSRGCDPNN